MKTKLYKWNIEDSLKTPEDRAAYIEAAMEANDPVAKRVRPDCHSKLPQ